MVLSLAGTLFASDAETTTSSTRLAARKRGSRLPEFCTTSRSERIQTLVWVAIIQQGLTLLIGLVGAYFFMSSAGSLAGNKFQNCASSGFVCDISGRKNRDNTLDATSAVPSHVGLASESLVVNRDVDMQPNFRDFSRMWWSAGYGPGWTHAMYWFAGILALGTHWLGHRRFGGWNERWFRAHTVEHHLRLYPPKRFLAGESLGADDGNAKFYLPTWMLTGLLTFAVFGSIGAMLFQLAITGFWFAIVNEFHSAYHLKGHRLEGQRWFMVLREIHFLHHIGDQKQNYGITDFSIDALLQAAVFC